MNPIQHAIGDLLDILPDAVVMVDARSIITFVNPAMRALLGYTPAEILGQPLSMLIPQDSRDRHDAVVQRYRREGSPKMMGARPVLHALHRSGKVVPVSISLCNLTLDGGELASVAVIHDVSALHTHLDRATTMAETDPLTGLGNRLRLSRRIGALAASGRAFSLLWLDLVDFKRIRDAHGPEIADEALRVVGLRLQAQVREADLVARLGGDKFAMLLDGMSDTSHLDSRAHSVSHSLCRRMHIGPLIESVSVTIGGAIGPRHGTDEVALLDAATGAMDAARREGAVYRLAGAAADAIG